MSNSNQNQNAVLQKEGGKRGWKLNEIVILVILSVGLGVLWWGWTFLYGLITPLTAIGLNYLLVGFWFSGGVLIPFLIRKPGAALFGELMAALVESFITRWGISALLWGLVQGAGAELIFFITRYKKYNLPVLILASIVAAVFSYVLDFFYSHYAGLPLWVILVQISSLIVSSVILSGFLSYLIGKRILNTGVITNLSQIT